MAYMTVLFISLLFISLNLQAFYYEIAGLKVTFADIAIVIGLFYGILRSFRARTKRVSSSYYIPHICIILYLLWNGIAAMISPDVVSGTTLFLQQVRNFLLFFLITMLPFNVNDYQRVNFSLFTIGIIFSVIGIGLYYSSYLNIGSIIKNPTTWHGVIGYELDKTGYLRANGLAGDSNFYAIFLMLSLFCGLSINKSRFLKYGGLFLIMVAILLAFSRSILVALVLTLFAMYFIRLVKLSRRDFFYITAMAIFLVFSSVCIFLVFEINMIEVMELRFTDISGGYRSYLWNILIHMISESPLWGHGLRTAQNVTGIYSHNTYIELLVDTGLIGATLFGLILLSVFILMLKVRNNRKITDAIRPWNFMFIYTLFFSFVFSFGTNPFFWLVLSMVVSSYKINGDQKWSRLRS